MRCFIAIELDDRCRAALGRLIDAGQSVQALRWTRAENLHLTLRFLGEVAAERVGAIASLMDRASHATPPGELTICGVGAFPNPRNPRVVWAGVEDAAELSQTWLTHAEPALAELGFPAEARPYTPHITLARLRAHARPGPAADWLQTARLTRRLPLPVTHTALFESRRQGSATEYIRLHRAALRD